jgi:hypothetical protein
MLTFSLREKDRMRESKNKALLTRHLIAFQAGKTGILERFA